MRWVVSDRLADRQTNELTIYNISDNISDNMSDNISDYDYISDVNKKEGMNHLYDQVDNIGENMNDNIRQKRTNIVCSHVMAVRKLWDQVKLISIAVWCNCQ